MAGARQRMGAGQSGRACADHRDAAAGRWASLIELPSSGKGGIRREALQAADLDGAALRCLAHAGPFAEVFRRADPGAHRTHDIGIEDGLRGRYRLAVGDLANEERYVDRGRAGRNAGRIVAEEAALGGDPRLVWIERRSQISEIGGALSGGKAPGCNVSHPVAPASISAVVQAWTGPTLNLTRGSIPSGFVKRPADGPAFGHWRRALACSCRMGFRM